MIEPGLARWTRDNYRRLGGAGRVNVNVNGNAGPGRLAAQRRDRQILCKQTNIQVNTLVGASALSSPLFSGNKRVKHMDNNPDQTMGQ